MWRFAARSLALALVIAACRQEPAATVPTTPPVSAGAAPKLLARGTYVATIAGCVTCHQTMRPGRIETQPTLGGGLEVTMTDGQVWRAPNISADRDVGVGGWSDAALFAAIRTGIRPDGSRLLPIMPYPYFHQMTNDDAAAVIAYIRAQPPVWNVIPRNRIAGMRPVALQAPVANVDPDDPQRHGEYLANLMHCAGCHTATEGPTAGKPFAGGVAFRLLDGRTIQSANITSDDETGIGMWSADDVIHAVRTMTDPQGRKLEGPMTMYADAWSRLSDKDARALAQYIKSIPAVRTQHEDEEVPTVSSRP